MTWMLRWLHQEGVNPTLYIKIILTSISGKMQKDNKAKGLNAKL